MAISRWGWTVLRLALGTGLASWVACSAPERVETQPLRIVEVVRRGESEIFSLPIERYQTADPRLPIGVFDSGIGGLTVLDEILTIDRFNNSTYEPGPDGHADFADESFVYLGDQANMPYGNYPAEGKLQFLKELVVKDALFLLGDRYWPSGSAEAPRRDKPPVKAIVVACNTATAFGFEDIARALATWQVSMPLIGVVAAGAEGAVETMSGSDAPGVVAVMATVGTCASQGYPRQIAWAARAAGIPAPRVVQQGSLGLAGAIEGGQEFIVTKGSDAATTYRGPAVGNEAAPIDLDLVAAYDFDPDGLLGSFEDPRTWRLNSVDNYIRYDTTTLVESYRRSGATAPITTVVLGCTHFPFHVAAIDASFARLREYRTADGEAPYEGLISRDITFVDPARLTAVELYQALVERGIVDGDDDTPSPSTDEFYISVPNAACPGVELQPDGLTFTHAYKYGRSPGELDREYVKRVPMSRDTLTTEVLESIRTTMPAVWQRLVAFSLSSPRCAGSPEEARISENGARGEEARAESEVHR